MYWEVRRQSYEALLRQLVRLGLTPESGVAADLGAGIGWLAYRLAEAGYRTLAVEASVDVAFGIGAALVYQSATRPGFLALQGDLEYPPLRPGALALAIMNASLHYAQDLQGTVQRVANALQPGGCLAILDTPVAERPRPGSGRGDRHLGQEELSEALLAADLRPSWIPVRRSWRWWLFQAKAKLRRTPRFSFPLVLGLRSALAD
jgi:SAM-dependent methyltransferase